MEVQEPPQQPPQDPAQKLQETEQKDEKIETNEERRGFAKAQEQQMAEFFAEHPCFWGHADQDFNNRSRNDSNLMEISRELNVDGEYTK